MKRLNLLKFLVVLTLTSGILLSCSEDGVDPVPTSFEVSGSSFDEIYVLDESYTKGVKYVNQDSDSEYIKTYNSKGVEMWGLHKVHSGDTYLYYIIEKAGPYPPESGWTCSIGPQKPIRVVAMYE